MNEEKTKEKENVAVKLGSALSTLVVVIAVLICLNVIVQVTTNGYVQIGGYSLFRVVTGSMEPELPVGCLVLVKKTTPEEVVFCFIMLIIIKFVLNVPSIEGFFFVGT